MFDFSSETTERNSTKLDRKQDFNALYQVCVFQVDRKNKMAAPAYDFLTRSLYSGERQWPTWASCFRAPPPGWCPIVITLSASKH